MVPETRRTRRRSCLAFHELAWIVFGVANIGNTDGFLNPTTTTRPADSWHQQRRSSLSSQKTDASIGVKSMPFFSDPKKESSSSSSSSPEDHPPEPDDGVRAGGGDSVLPGILRLASMHCTSAALNAAVRLRIPDILGDRSGMSVDELAFAI